MIRHSERQVNQWRGSTALFTGHRRTFTGDKGSYRQSCPEGSVPPFSSHGDRLPRAQKLTAKYASFHAGPEGSLSYVRPRGSGPSAVAPPGVRGAQLSPLSSLRPEALGSQDQPPGLPREEAELSPTMHVAQGVAQCQGTPSKGHLALGRPPKVPSLWAGRETGCKVPCPPRVGALGLVHAGLSSTCLGRNSPENPHAPGLYQPHCTHHCILLGSGAAWAGPPAPTALTSRAPEGGPLATPGRSDFVGSSSLESPPGKPEGRWHFSLACFLL